MGRPPHPPVLGERFSVRRRLADGNVGDVVGVLTQIDDAQLTLRDRHGVLHSVARASILASRRVPPRPATRS